MKVQPQCLTIPGCPGIVFNIDNLNKHIKKAPDKDEGNLMFSQRNNPYCELFQISESNSQLIIWVKNNGGNCF